MNRRYHPAAPVAFLLFFLSFLPAAAQPLRGVWDIVGDYGDESDPFALYSVAGVTCLDSLDCIAYAQGFTDALLRSRDGGMTWTFDTITFSGVSGKRGSVVRPVPSLLLIPEVRRYLHRSTDAGATWERIDFVDNSELRDCRLVDSLYGTMMIGEAGYIDGYLLTEDGGATWNRHNAPIPDGWSDTLMAVQEVSPLTRNVVVVAVSLGDTTTAFNDNTAVQFLRSEDNGATWETTLAVAGRDSVVLYTMRYDFRDSLNGVLIVNWRSLPEEVDTVRSYYDIYQSNNGGRTWKQIHYRLSLHTLHPDSYFHELAFRDSLDGYIATSHGIIHTSDGGTTWTRDSVEKAPALFSLPNPGFLLNRRGLPVLATETNYIYRRSRELPASVQTRQIETTRLSMSQNNGQLRVYLPADHRFNAPLELTVVDARGARVLRQTWPGTASVIEIGSKSLPPGIYYILLRSGSWHGSAAARIVR